MTVHTLPIPGCEDIKLVFVTEHGETQNEGVAMPVPLEQRRLCFSDGVCHCPACVASGEQRATWDTLRITEHQAWTVHWPEIANG